ncbi:hypothetical protein PVAND_011884 [Polypedilum vanderplanki]|uniref:Short-chain dehydrogenase/reductase 3 n=1 Tax=Polypedilum vanderplanki TaxID=319348 RepID=A0A9J6CJY2_POLVA|nr:hypothetical protein PVAND_011884 [Polypedilum vanderplanki]
MAQPTENIFGTVFNIFCLIFEILLIVVKFLVAVSQAIYETFTAEERSVEGDIVLITGAGHGIGKELALQYSALGATIVCWDINEQLNLDTVNLIKSKGKKAFGYTVDVTNREKVLETGAKVLREVGDVTILLNNAGVMPQHEFLKHTENEIRKIFEINVLAHFWMFQAFLPKMIENNKGHIVGLSSMAGLMGLRNLVPYCGSKYAVRGIQEALSEELRASSNGNSKIKFTTVFPYMVDTGLCKTVKIRFDNFMKLVNVSEAAAAIISAQRKGLEEITIPRYLFHVMRVGRLFPNVSMKVVKDFMEAFVESDQ